MQVSSLFIATLALVAAAPINKSTEQQMSGVQGAMTNARQVQDTLNEQLKQNNAHSNQAAVNAFITGADSQIDNAIATISEALAPFTLGASQAVGDFLLGPFVQSVTNGAEVLLSNLIGGGADLIDAQLVGALTGNYSRLASFATKNNVDASKLEHLNQEITKSVAGSKGKRDEGGMDGIKGAITNMKQTIDTMKNDMENDKGHGAQEAVTAFITGADSQIDNLAATIANGLNGVTLGISGKIGDFLLGPFVQAVTNGAEVVVSNVIGGSIDIVTDGTAKLFSDALSQLHKLAVNNNVNENDTKALADVQKKVKDLKSHNKSKSSKRDTSSLDMEGLNGAMTNARQVQDTLNDQLKSHNGHAVQAVVNAFITGADSQIDNAIATVSDALAPLTLGASKAIGDFLLGPFVQSVTNGAEVLISNLIGGGADAIADTSLALYNNALSELTKEATKYGIKTDSLEKAQSDLAKYLPKSH